MLSLEWVTRNAIALLLLPPGSLLILGFWGVILIGRRPRLGKAVALLSLAALYALSTPLAANALLQALEGPVRDPLSDRRGDAVVILGGGKYYAAPEYGGSDTVRAATLVRLRYGAHLQRKLEKPVLVTGGSPEGSPSAEAWLMKDVLQHDFGVPVAWVEDKASTTLGSAYLSRALLDAKGANSIYLVTHAWHMRRARLAFEHVGFTVIPAPTGHATGYRLTPLDFLPQAIALLNSAQFFHEVLGIAWYRLKFQLSR